jgi:hypothetical protein
MSETKHSHAELDWSTATVSDETLTVGFTERPSKAWVERLEAIVDRLQRAGEPWEAVKVKSKRVKVAGVTSGAEDDLRHFLEGAVLQANADFAPDADEECDDKPSETDETMTARFQAFAPAESPDAART